MDKQREKFVSEINRMEEAINKSKSEKLKRDYSKALKKMKRELKDYDNFKKGA